ncbi:cobalamin-binding protein [Microbulbifer sp. OS29]|uniref:Cobalamin-binding protein n=1 Tax=Microbulbifer okhotskensis TaxID=2926617 RepID=A0A9X2EQV8_9GAMM|nr:cobalamin-binding protein [Microbulbifer okhotskensis]MCO1336159.1 cobalamin-binding protein [Microbulbifer okhotskensis]
MPRSSIVKLVLVLGLLLAGFSRANEPVRVQDARGHWIELPTPAKRIVALAPNIVENFYSAGAGEKLVAAVSYSDYPEQAKQLPQIGNYKVVNYESLLLLKADLVVAWGSGNGNQMINKLENLGFTVFVSESKTLEDIAENVQRFGELAGTSDYANRAVKNWLKRLTKQQTSYKSLDPVSVFYQVWNDPLQTLNGDHLISHVIETCGGRNIFSDALVLAPKISIEAVLNRDPQVIIASGMGEERPEWLDTWVAYPRLRAVKESNLFHVPPDIIQRHTFRVLDGMEMVCDKLSKVRSKG